jgi:hypothetical protein
MYVHVTKSGYSNLRISPVAQEKWLIFPIKLFSFLARKVLFVKPETETYMVSFEVV